jgi:hypothetical protein
MDEAYGDLKRSSRQQPEQHNNFKISYVLKHLVSYELESLLATVRSSVLKRLSRRL